MLDCFNLCESVVWIEATNPFEREPSLDVSISVRALFGLRRGGGLARRKHRGHQGFNLCESVVWIEAPEHYNAGNIEVIVSISVRALFGLRPACL